MPSGWRSRKSATPRQPLAREDALVDHIGLARANRVGGGARRALVVAARIVDLEHRQPVGPEALEVGALVLDPLPEDQLGLLVLDLGPLELPARKRERERRQVLAGEEGRDVGRREVEPVGGDVHPGRVAEAAAVAYSQPSVGRLRAASHVLDDRGGDRLDPAARDGDDGRRAPRLRIEVRDLVAELGRAGDQDEVGPVEVAQRLRSRFDARFRRSAGARADRRERRARRARRASRRRGRAGARPPASHASTSSARARSFREPPQRVHAEVATVTISRPPGSVRAAQETQKRAKRASIAARARSSFSSESRLLRGFVIPSASRTARPRSATAPVSPSEARKSPIGRSLIPTKVAVLH